MSTLDWLYSTNPWFGYLASILLLAAAGELGFRVGAVRRRRGDTVTSEVTTLEGAFLGLLALMIGFTFSIAVNRFDARRSFLVDEVNAIGTADLRARLLPEPQASEVRRLLRDYVQVRIDLIGQPPDEATLRAAIDRSGGLQQLLWQHGMAAAAADPRSMPVALFLQALNEMFDLQAKRVAASGNHVPAGVFALLYVIAMVSAGFNGYAAGLLGRGGRSPNMIAIALVADIDRPSGGLVTISQQPLLDLLAGMQK